MGNTIHNTKIFNQTLEALDTGKRLYAKGIYGFYPLRGFYLDYDDNNENYICLKFPVSNTVDSEDIFYIYPSKGYNSNNLYTPQIIEYNEGAYS